MKETNESEMSEKEILKELSDLVCGKVERDDYLIFYLKVDKGTELPVGSLLLCSDGIELNTTDNIKDMNVRWHPHWNDEATTVCAWNTVTGVTINSMSAYYDYGSHNKNDFDLSVLDLDCDCYMVKVQVKDIKLIEDTYFKKNKKVIATKGSIDHKIEIAPEITYKIEDIHPDEIEVTIKNEITKSYDTLILMSEGDLTKLSDKQIEKELTTLIKDKIADLKRIKEIKENVTGILSL